LNFQVGHLADFYQRLPRHSPDDLQAMQHAIALLRSIDLQTLDFPLPVSGRSIHDAAGPSQLDATLSFVQALLPSWADNISLTYFNHARTYPISIGG